MSTSSAGTAQMKANLKAAKDCLKEGKHKEALQYCKSVLKVNKTSYEAYLYVPTAIFADITLLVSFIFHEG
jgi:two-component SAPR family response regulator